MSTYFIGYITRQVFCKARNIAVNVSAQNNNGYENEKKVLCLSFVVEIKREPEKKSPQLCDFKNRLQRGFFS